jgi:hypothetical protein
MIEGSCLCGAVTIRLAAHDPAVTACHCRMCLRWTGGPFAGFDAPVEAVSVSGDVTTYASSAFAERAFCPRCGSHLWFRDTVPAGRPYEFPPGLFPAADGFPLTREVYADRAPRWARFAGAHDRVGAAEYETDNPFVREGDVP